MKSENTMKPNIDKFNKIYLKAFGYNPCPMGEPELEKFYDLVVMQCMEAALNPMNYDSTECGEDVATDIAMVIQQSLSLSIEKNKEKHHGS